MPSSKSKLEVVNGYMETPEGNMKARWVPVGPTVVLWLSTNYRSIWDEHRHYAFKATHGVREAGQVYTVMYCRCGARWSGTGSAAWSQLRNGVQAKRHVAELVAARIQHEHEQVLLR